MVLGDDTNSMIEIFRKLNTPCFIIDEDKTIVWQNESASHVFPKLCVGATESFFLSEEEEPIIFERLKKNLPVQIEKDLYPLSNTLLSFVPISQNPFLVASVLSKRISAPDATNNSQVLDAFANAYKTNIASNDSIYSYIFKKILDKDDYETSKYMQILVRNNYKMLRDTNNIVTMTKILNNAFQLKTVYSDIISYLKSSLDAIALLVEPTDIPFTFSLPNQAVYTRFDPEQLNAILTNLISNSYIYTRDFNKVEVKVDISNSQVVMKISDKGLGIKPELMAFVTKPYFSFNEINHLGGIGAGLFLVNELAKLHNGTMLLHSVYCEGTSVSVTFPITEPEGESTVLNSKTSDYIKNKFSPLYVGLSDICFFPYP